MISASSLDFTTLEIDHANKVIFRPLIQFEFKKNQVLSSDHVNSIDAWEGKKEKCIPAKNKCFFENEHWNGVNEAGQELRLGFQKNFDETDVTPKIEKVIFKYCTSEDCDGWTRVVIECGEEDGSEDEAPVSEEETDTSEDEQNESEEEVQTDAPEIEESEEEDDDDEIEEETDGECSLGPDYLFLLRWSSVQD